MPQGPLMRKQIGPSRPARSVLFREQFPRAAIAQITDRAQYFGHSVLAHWDGSAMTDDKNKKAARMKDSRQDRLKNKLRENLKRRKSQERERSKLTDAPSQHEDASPHGEVGKGVV